MRRRLAVAALVPALAVALSACTFTITAPGGGGGSTTTTPSVTPSPTSVLAGKDPLTLLPDDASVQAAFPGYTTDNGGETLQDPNPIALDASMLADASATCGPALQPFTDPTMGWSQTALVVYQSPDENDAITWIIGRAADAQSAQQFIAAFQNGLQSCTAPGDANVWGFPGGVAPSTIPGAVGWGEDGNYGAFLADGDLLIMVAGMQSGDVDQALTVQLTRLAALG